MPRKNTYSPVVYTKPFLIESKMNQKGFSQIILLGIIAVIILAGAGGFLVFREKKMLSSENRKTVQQEESSEDMTSPIEATTSALQRAPLSKLSIWRQFIESILSPSSAIRSTKPPQQSSASRLGNFCSGKDKCINR